MILALSYTCMAEAFAGVCKLYIRERIHCKHNHEAGDYFSGTT